MRPLIIASISAAALAFGLAQASAQDTTTGAKSTQGTTGSATSGSAAATTDSSGVNGTMGAAPTTSGRSTAPANGSTDAGAGPNTNGAR